MRFISFGDLYVDYYMNNGLVIGINGGKTNANIIANLSKYYDTSFFGVAGLDIQGDVAISSLSKLGVDVTNIKRVDKRTKKYFISNKEVSATCPVCGRNISYKNPLYDPEEVKTLIKEDDLIIVDNLNKGVIDVLDSVTNKAFLDLGCLGSLLYLSLDEILDLLKDRFEIINMNEKVYNVLRNKYKLDLVDFYELINPHMLIITRGKKGSFIVYNSEVYEKEIEDPASEVDASGAGDAFFSEFIRTIVDANFEINEKVISLAYMRASSISRFVVMNYGARTHLEPLIKIKDYRECVCDSIEID